MNIMSESLTNTRYRGSYTSCRFVSTFIKQVQENVIKRASGELNNVFMNEFNKSLYETTTSVGFFLSHDNKTLLKRFLLCFYPQNSSL